MLTLAVDTSSATESVALLADREILAERTVRVLTNHAASLIPSIDSILSACGLKISDIDLYALTVGPGSFTGLRIAASAIKGLAFSSGKPMVGVSTLEALACNAAPTPYPVCPLMDARRKEVYAALYRIRDNGYPERLLADRVVAPEKFIANTPERTLFLGEGARKYSQVIADLNPSGVVFGKPGSEFVRAANVGLLGVDLYFRGQTLDLITFSPAYLRLPQAEENKAGRSPQYS